MYDLDAMVPKSVVGTSKQESDQRPSCLMASIKASSVAAVLAMFIDASHDWGWLTFLDHDADGDFDMDDVNSMFDANKDGKLDVDEILHLIVVLTGLITLVNILIFLQVHSVLTTTTARKRSLRALFATDEDGKLPRRIRRLFKAYDEDNNGSLDCNELTQLLQDLQPGLPTAAAKMVFSRMDLDHNERVSVAEFTRFVEIGDANQIYLRTKWEYGSWSTFFSDNDRLLA